MTADYLDASVDIDSDRFVSAYDEAPLWSARFGFLLLDNLPFRTVRRILDVGFGTGFPLLEIAERFGQGTQVFGIDPWRSAAARTEVKMEEYGIKNVSLRCGDAAEMPFEDGFFDVIVSNLGVNNFAHRNAVLAESRRVLAQSGTLALTTNFEGHMQEFYDAFDATLTAVSTEALRAPLLEHIQRRSTLDKTRAILAGAGFRVVRTVEESFCLRFLDGSALLRHHFIRLAFLPAWRDLIPPESRQEFFTALEARLNDIAKNQGHLRLTIPMAYIEAEKESEQPRRADAEDRAAHA
jgi:ubiquinone/menaquinone biosynthesis C-methylase UbiE